MSKQKGFSLVEGLLIILVISVIGFGGYYVWSQNDDEEPATTQTNQQQTTQNQETGQPAQEAANVPEGWVIYENEALGLSFAYPEEWGEVALEQAGDYSPQYLYVTFSGNEDIRGSIVSDSSSYTGEGRGGAYWEILEKEGGFEEILASPNGQVLSSDNSFLVSAYGSCVTGNGAILEANYRVASNESSVDVIRLATTYELPQGLDCADASNEVVLESIDGSVIEDFIEFRNYINQ